MIKKTMHFHMRHVISLLFSVYFLLYVLSPFCFAQNGLHDESPIAYQSNHSTKSIRIIWELILTNIYKQSRDNDSSSQAHVQLLLKKAKALVNTGSPLNLSSSLSAEIIFDDMRFNQGQITSLVPFEKPLFQGFTRLLSSGLSPPAV